MSQRSVLSLRLKLAKVSHERQSNFNEFQTLGALKANALAESTSLLADPLVHEAAVYYWI